MYGVATVASVLILVGVIKWGPREISEGVNQLIVPRALAAATNAMSIKVKPEQHVFRKVLIRTFWQPW